MLARSFYRRMIEMGELRRMRSIAIHVRSAQATGPTVYFATPDHDVPAGGIRVIYRHVDILNSAGINASVTHRKRGFKCTWFKHDTRITDFANLTLRRGDLLVMPEVDVQLLSALPRGIRYAIFNQNSHLTWKGSDDKVVWSVYQESPDLAGVVTVSSHSMEMLQHAFPACRVRRLHLGIDKALFHPGDGPRARRIAYMPRRGRDDCLQVLKMLCGRAAIEDWELVPLDGLPHEKVAECLRTTQIFLAFTAQEGFGLPAAEAMACGNYVIGNHGFGGREFFLPRFSTSVQVGDILGFVHAVEAVLASERRKPGWCAEKGRQAARFIHSRYSVARERAEVERIYSDFLAMPGSGGNR